MNSSNHSFMGAADFAANAEFFRIIVESVKEGIVVIQGGEKVYYNLPWLELTEYAAEEYQNLRFLSLVHPDDIDFVSKRYDDLVGGKIDEPKLEFRLLTKSGRIKYIDAKISL